MSELSEQLNKVMERLEELEKTPSELTKDSLLAELRELYDAVKGVNTTQTVEAEPHVVEEPKEQPQPKEPEARPEPVVVAEVPQNEPEPEVEEATVAPEAEAEEVPQLQPTEKVVAEADETTVTETVSEKKPLIGNDEKPDKAADQNILAGQLSRKPLEDLRTGIPLNEKFGIIRSLFKGNASDYGDAVLKLNNAVNPTEMRHYLNLLQQRFGWDLESEAYATFSVYVERKMLTLETSDANADQ